MNKIRVCVVGCGRVSKYHINAINSLNDKYELVALCDNDKNKLSELNNQFNIPLYDDLERMLINEKFDILSICTPSGYHFQNAILASNYNKDVITEKPITTKLNDAIKMVNVFKESELNLYVVKQNRYNPTLEILKKAITQKRFGKIHMININVFWTRPQQYYNQADWRGTKEFDGGALMNQASHYVDLLHWLGGPIERVNAIKSTFLDIEVEDTITMNVSWKNGTIGSMNVTMLTFPKNLEGSVLIIGEKGTAKVAGVACNKIVAWEFNDKQPEDEDIVSLNYEPEDVYGNGHKSYYQKLFEMRSNNQIFELDGTEGLKTLEIITAAYISVEKKKTVELPLSGKDE